MIEKVARALHAADTAWGDVPWGALDEPQTAAFRRSASAAISAMAEPTEEMLEAGDACDGFTRYDDNASARTHWEAMIQAALTPPR